MARRYGPLVPHERAPGPGRRDGMPPSRPATVTFASAHHKQRKVRIDAYLASRPAEVIWLGGCQRNRVQATPGIFGLSCRSRRPPTEPARSPQRVRLDMSVSGKWHRSCCLAGNGGSSNASDQWQSASYLLRMPGLFATSPFALEISSLCLPMLNASSNT
jgi:hypothetical protein